MISHTKSLEVDLGIARRLITVASFVTACAVVALHAPSHVSMDTSFQLYEANTGLAVSWNPPFMSDLLLWLGDDELATTAIVLLQVMLLFGGKLLAINVLLRERAHDNRATQPCISSGHNLVFCHRAYPQPLDTGRVSLTKAGVGQPADRGRISRDLRLSGS